MTLWSVKLEHFARADSEWVEVCSLESGRYLFDSIDSVKAEAARIYGPDLEWEPLDNGDWWADGGHDTRIVASWTEGLPRGGREML